MVTPNMVQILAGGREKLYHQYSWWQGVQTGWCRAKTGGRMCHVGYGETIGFWDEDVLITWTSNIQAWKNHSAPEHLKHDADGGDIYT